MELVIEFIDKYSIIIGTTKIYPNLLFIVACLSLVLWSIRCIMWTYIIRKSVKDRRVRLRKTLICCGNSLIGAVVAFSISVIITIVTDTMLNIPLSCFVFPMIGFIGSYLFDVKVMMEVPDTPCETHTKPKSQDKTSDKSGNTVIVNVGSNIEETANTNQHILDSSDTELIKESDIDLDDYSEKVREAVNELRAIQIKHGEQIEEQSDILRAVRDTMMTDKKYQLKNMIYTALDNGYVTPDDNERIVAEYNNYRALRGNGEVQRLFEVQYSKLDVHEDRRQDQVYVKKDRRKKPVR